MKKMDQERISCAMQNLITVLNDESPLCPVCAEKMTLDEDHITYGYDDLDDYDGTLIVNYNCDRCQQGKITISMLTIPNVDVE